MKIAIDLRPLQTGHENRGVGNYLLNILAYFPTKDTSYVFIRYDKSNPIKDYSLKIGKNKYEEVVIKRRDFSKNPKKLLLFLADFLKPIFGKVKKYKPDIYFQPDYLFGLPRGRNIKTVVVMYDIIPLLFRDMYLPSWRKFLHFKQYRLRSRVLLSTRALYYSNKYRGGVRAVKHADKVLSISNTTTADIVRVLHIPKEKIKTTHLAPSFVSSIQKTDSTNLKDSIAEIRGKYLLFIGGTDARRQVYELVYAFNLLNAQGHDITLVLAGNEFTENSDKLNPRTKKAVETSSYKDKILLLGKINEDDKRLLFKNSLAFVFPTLYEGFGLPIVESMISGSPVITYRNSATTEMAEDAALYTAQDNGIGIYDCVKMLLDDDTLRSELIKRGIKRAGQFSWDTTGTETVDYILSS